MWEELVQTTKMGGIILLSLIVLDVIIQIMIHKYEKDENKESWFLEKSYISIIYYIGNK